MLTLITLFISFIPTQEKAPLYIEKLFTSDLIKPEWFEASQYGGEIYIFVELDEFLKEKLETESEYIEYKLPDKVISFVPDKVLFTNRTDRYIKFSVIDISKSKMNLKFHILESENLLEKKKVAEGSFKISYVGGVWNKGHGQVKFFEK